jgi:hypothetical protein
MGLHTLTPLLTQHQCCQLLARFLGDSQPKKLGRWKKNFVLGKGSQDRSFCREKLPCTSSLGKLLAIYELQKNPTESDCYQNTRFK